MIPAQRIADAINGLADGQKAFLQTTDSHAYLEFARVDGALEYRCCFQDAIGMDVLESVRFMTDEADVHAAGPLVLIESRVYAHMRIEIRQDGIKEVSSILPMAHLDEEDES